MLILKSTFAQQPFVAIARLGLCSEFSTKIQKLALYFL
jgi:hypothetical protein